MGCDIHAYVEWVEKDKVYREGSWTHSVASFFPGRNYWMFNLLAGVRHYVGDPDPVFAPKGLPEKLGWEAQSYNRFYVVDDDSKGEGDRLVKRSVAQGWVTRGLSKWEEDGNCVTHPDWHNHSWLNAAELEKVAAAYAVYHNPVPLPYKSLFAAVAALGENGRLVFWFDN